MLSGLDRLLRVQRLRRRERRELAHRVSDHIVGRDPAQAQHGEHGKARGHERRLLDLGLDELLERRLEAQAPEVEIGGATRLVENLHRLREGLGQIAAHALLERSLPGKTECNLVIF